jgi:hypothetical protein
MLGPQRVFNLFHVVYRKYGPYSRDKIEINDWCKSDDNAPINCVVTSISSNRRYVLSGFKGVYTL